MSQKAALDNLRYQAACFRRASASGHAPRLKRVLPPCADLPLGALIVEYIAGRPLHMPAELAQIAPALAALHNLPLPAAAHQPPLRDSADADPAQVCLEYRASLRRHDDCRIVIASDVSERWILPFGPMRWPASSGCRSLETMIGA